MERQQDSNLWASSAIYAATNSILLVAFFSERVTPVSMILLGLVGLIVSIAWIITTRRARTYEDL